MKVTVYGKGKLYSEEIDYDEYELDRFSADQLRSLDKFDSTDIDQYNGNHFIFGWWECFGQSDNVPMWMVESKQPLQLEFERSE